MVTAEIAGATVSRYRFLVTVVVTPDAACGNKRNNILAFCCQIESSRELAVRNCYILCGSVAHLYGQLRAVCGTCEADGLRLEVSTFCRAGDRKVRRSSQHVKGQGLCILLRCRHYRMRLLLRYVLHRQGLLQQYK